MKGWPDDMMKYTDLKLADPLIWEWVGEESKRQIEKWGIQTRTLPEWLMYLTEEVGELAEAIAEEQYRNGDAMEIVKESVQVATLAMKIGEMVLDLVSRNIKRERMVQREKHTMAGERSC